MADSDLDPKAFLQTVRDLSDKRQKEDNERYEKLEAEIMQDRSSRLARRLGSPTAHAARAIAVTNQLQNENDRYHQKRRHALHPMEAHPLLLPLPLRRHAILPLPATTACVVEQ